MGEAGRTAGQDQRYAEAAAVFGPAPAVFGVALFLGVGWLNAHTARKRQRDIDALDTS